MTDVLATVNAAQPDTARERARIESKLPKPKVQFLETEDMTREEYLCRKDRYQRQLELLEPVVTTSDTAIELVRYLRALRAWFTDANEFERNLMLQHVLSTMVVDGQEIKAIGLVPQTHRLLEAYASHATRLGA